MLQMETIYMIVKRTYKFLYRESQLFLRVLKRYFPFQETFLPHQ